MEFGTLLATPLANPDLIRAAYLVISWAPVSYRSGDPNGIRTRVTPVKGECPRPLDDRVLKRTDMVAPSRKSASGNIILATSSNDKASSRSQIVKLGIRILDCVDSGQPIPLHQTRNSRKKKTQRTQRYRSRNRKRRIYERLFNQNLHSFASLRLGVRFSGFQFRINRAVRALAPSC